MGPTNCNVPVETNMVVVYVDEVVVVVIRLCKSYHNLFCTSKSFLINFREFGM